MGMICEDGVPPGALESSFCAVLYPKGERGGEILFDWKIPQSFHLVELPFFIFYYYE